MTNDVLIVLVAVGAGLVLLSSLGPPIFKWLKAFSQNVQVPDFDILQPRDTRVEDFAALLRLRDRAKKLKESSEEGDKAKDKYNESIRNLAEMVGYCLDPPDEK